MCHQYTVRDLTLRSRFQGFERVTNGILVKINVKKL